MLRSVEGRHVAVSGGWLSAMVWQARNRPMGDTVGYIGPAARNTDRYAVSKPGVEIGYAAHVSIVETVLVFAVIPLAIYGLIALGTLRSKFGSAPRYRPGQEWDYPPVWWTANPEGLAGRAQTREQSQRREGADGVGSGTSTNRGGASGNW